METIRVHGSLSPTDVERVVGVLRTGGVIAFPTETTYGFGCDPKDARAVSRLFEIKQRPEDRACIVIADSVGMVLRAADMREAETKLADAYWPGPLSMVLHMKDDSGYDSRISQAGTLAIRVPSSDIARKIVQAFESPIVATSANFSGEEPCRSGSEVIERFADANVAPDLLIDAGRLPFAQPSTLVQVGDDGAINILRQGECILDV